MTIKEPAIEPNQEREIRLTQLAHGGGCGCKLAPSILSGILTAHSDFPPVANLLVGRETSDDAAVFQLRPDLALVATVDFFMPIVDDPRDFGRIAAANAISDVYAMGGQPLLALAIVGMPISKISSDTIRKILSGGEEVCREAEITVAGGHSIDSLEPVYGLVVIGSIHPSSLKRNRDGEPDDLIILGKPLGTGIISAALRAGEVSRESYHAMLSTATQLNRPGPELAQMAGVHAMTDVTGFSLLGHLLEVCRGSGVGARIDVSSVPFIGDCVSLAQMGHVTGASRRNWDSFSHSVVLPSDTPDWLRGLLCDPQTSGGLLVACAPQVANDVLKVFSNYGFPEAAIIGELRSGPAMIDVVRTHV